MPLKPDGCYMLKFFRSQLMCHNSLFYAHDISSPKTSYLKNNINDWTNETSVFQRFLLKKSFP